MKDLDLGSKCSSKNEEGEGSCKDLHLPGGRRTSLGTPGTVLSDSLVLVFIREEDQEVTRQRFRTLFFGYTIDNMLFLKKGTGLRMQQEVEGKGAFMLSQLPSVYRHRE